MNAMISAANTARTLGLRWKALGREPNAEDVEAVTWAVYQRGLKVSGVEYVEAIAAVHAAGRKIAAFLASYDVILSTTLAGAAAEARLFRSERRCSDLHRARDRISVDDAAAQRDRHAGHERAAALDGGRPAGRRALRRPL